MTEREQLLEATLQSVVDVTLAERTAQRASDAAEEEYVVNPSVDDAVHKQLRENAKTARRALKDARHLAETTTAAAIATLNKKAAA